MKKAYYHLPGLFEFYELYKRFLPLYREHQEYFYEWCDIGSIYGAPKDCLWGGGRVECGDATPQEVISILREFDISARLTFSNSLLTTEHLKDQKCNKLCRIFSTENDNTLIQNGIIIYSDILLNYLLENYPSFYFISSTTKVLTSFDALKVELSRPQFRYVVPDFRLNKSFDLLDTLLQEQKEKVEFLCNECCSFGCTDRKRCYEDVSHKNLGDTTCDHICTSLDGKMGYQFSKAMVNPGFIGIQDICNTYLPMGFSNYKIEGRGLGSAYMLEFILYYLTKPEYQIHVREALYLDNMLDLF